MWTWSCIWGRSPKLVPLAFPQKTSILGTIQSFGVDRNFHCNFGWIWRFDKVATVVFVADHWVYLFLKQLHTVLVQYWHSGNPQRTVSPAPIHRNGSIKRSPHSALVLEPSISDVWRCGLKILEMQERFLRFTSKWTDFFSTHNFLETMEKEKDHQKTEALRLIVLRTSCVSWGLNYVSWLGPVMGY